MAGLLLRQLMAGLLLRQLMAAGYSWKLVRDGEEPQLAPVKQHLARQTSHSSMGSPLAAGDPARQGWGQGGLRLTSQKLASLA